MVTLPMSAELDNAVRQAAADEEPFLLAIRPERIGVLEKVPPGGRPASATSGRETFIVPVVFTRDDLRHVVRPYAIRIGRTVDRPDVAAAAEELAQRIDDLARASGMAVEHREKPHDDDREETGRNDP